MPVSIVRNRNTIVGGGIGNISQIRGRGVKHQGITERQQTIIIYLNCVLNGVANAQAGGRHISNDDSGFFQHRHWKWQHGRASINIGIACLRRIGVLAPGRGDQRAVHGVNFHARLVFARIENLQGLQRGHGEIRVVFVAVRVGQRAVCVAMVIYINRGVRQRRDPNRTAIHSAVRAARRPANIGYGG